MASPLFRTCSQSDERMSKEIRRSSKVGKKLVHFNLHACLLRIADWSGKEDLVCWIVEERPRQNRMSQRK